MRNKEHVLAVHTIRHSAMTRDAVTEVFDVERALEAGGEEPAEGGDEGGEAGENKEVQLVGCVRDRREVITDLEPQLI